MTTRSPARLDARGVPIVLPTQSPLASPRRRKQKATFSSSSRRLVTDSDIDEVELCKPRPKDSVSSKQDRSLLDEHDDFTDACHRSHFNHISRMFYQGSPQAHMSPNSLQDASTELLPTSQRPSPSSPNHQFHRRSPYGSPLQRLETARQARNKHPYVSPTRPTIGRKRMLPAEEPEPLNFLHFSEPPLPPQRKDGDFMDKLAKKQRTMAIFAADTNTADLWFDQPLQPTPSPMTLLSSQCQQQSKQEGAHMPTPLTQPTAEATGDSDHMQHSTLQSSQYQQSKPEGVNLSTPLTQQTAQPAEGSDHIQQQPEPMPKEETKEETAIEQSESQPPAKKEDIDSASIAATSATPMNEKTVRENAIMDEKTARENAIALRKQRIQKEMDTLTETVKVLNTHYKLLDKIGCGTFSSVYKALDVRYDQYDNSSWELVNHQVPSDMNHYQERVPRQNFVALKQIYATSSPKRMAHEIRILQKLRGSPCVAQLITAFRQSEFVFLVMPYFQHDEFKDCYSQMTMLDTKYYFKSLLTALKHLHSHHILHRDIKPNNFLYNMRMKTGMLIDFGLAQMEEETKPPEPPKPSSPARANNMVRKPTRSLSSTMLTSFSNALPSNAPATSVFSESQSQPLPSTSLSPSASQTSAKSLKPLGSKPINKGEDVKHRKPGYLKYDPRKSVKANRAGTRGFRAPEVLLRVTHQTVSIDIWSAGVILLSVLSGRFPFFIAHDEGESLIEIASIFGMKEMKQCAALHNRTFETNIETIPAVRKSLSKLCQVLNTEKFKLWSDDDKQNVDNAVDLMDKMLKLDYTQRITAEDALNHPFLSDLSLAYPPSGSHPPSNCK